MEVKNILSEPELKIMKRYPEWRKYSGNIEIFKNILLVIRGIWKLCYITYKEILQMMKRVVILHHRKESTWRKRAERPSGLQENSSHDFALTTYKDKTKKNLWRILRHASNRVIDYYFDLNRKKKRPRRESESFASRGL